MIDEIDPSGGPSAWRAWRSPPALSAALIPAARAQEMPFIDAERGTFLIHGNYCGPGNRSPRPPIDALDVACMHHDICSPPRGQIATCACNDRLHAEAEAVSQDPTSARRACATRPASWPIPRLALPCR